MKALGERQISLDCDVIQADGGTRTASVTGAWIALRLATKYLLDEGVITTDPILDQVAAISCGVFNGTPVLDLDYEEDSNAEADANFVLTARATSSRSRRPARSAASRRASSSPCSASPARASANSAILPRGSDRGVEPRPSSVGLRSRPAARGGRPKRASRQLASERGEEGV
jgi:hypothetical protein